MHPQAGAEGGRPAPKVQVDPASPSPGLRPLPWGLGQGELHGSWRQGGCAEGPRVKEGGAVCAGQALPGPDPVVGTASTQLSHQGTKGPRTQLWGELPGTTAEHAACPLGGRGAPGRWPGAGPTSPAALSWGPVCSLPGGRWQHLQTVWVVTTGAGCHWRPLDRGQGSCWPAVLRTKPPQRATCPARRLEAEAEKRCVDRGG